MGWEIRVEGEKVDLELLSRSFTAPELTIESRDGSYWLLTNRFGKHDKAREVLDWAKSTLRLMFGASRDSIGARSCPQVAEVLYRNPDGQRNLFMIIEQPLEFRIRLVPPTLIAPGDSGKAVSQPADVVRDRLMMAETDDSVKTVLRLSGEGPADWVGLYRIYEVVAKDCSGDRALYQKGLISEAKLRLFKHTANSPGAAGDLARHGAESSTPPPSPMQLHDARNLIGGLVEAWLKAKLARFLNKS